MKILPTIGVALLTFSLLAGGFIFYTKTTQAQELLPAYQYDIISQSENPVIAPDQPGFLIAKLKNTGTAGWPTNQLYLANIYFDGTGTKASPFATTAWMDQTKILADSAKETIQPNKTITFYIPIQTPARPALFQEIFQLYIGSTTATGANIKWLIQVGNELSYQADTGKQIRIWLADQKLWIIENGVVLLDTPISSGKSGYNTPKGNFKILNHIDTAYSSRYSLFMDNWMALYNKAYGFTGMGLHALPHWKVKQGNRIEGEIKDGRLYTNGKLYEDYAHLGKPMSHGCIRVGIEASKVLYDWAPNNTPVIIA